MEIRKTSKQSSKGIIPKWKLKEEKYLVKSVFIGKANIKELLLKLAESKTLSQMGIR